MKTKDLFSNWAASVVLTGLLGFTLLFSAAAPALPSVSLSSVANIDGISTLGVAVTIPNLDGSNGGAYASNLLGTSRSFGGATFTFLAPGAKSAVVNAVIPLSAGKFTAVKFLGGSSGANQVNQSFIVTYTDGTTKTFTQSLSNYGGTPQNYPNETVVLTMPYKIATTGVQHNGSYHVLGYSFALDSTKTVKSLTLPNSSVFVIAMDLIATGTPTATPVSLTGVANIDGIGTLGVPVRIPNLDGSAGGAYASNLLGTSRSFGGATFTFLAPGAKSAVVNAVIPLPAGKFTAVKFLGGSSGTNLLNQSFIVTYTDGTTKTFTQSLSNYGGTPQNYPNETVVLTMPYKIATTGVQHNGSYHVLGYSFALDSTKTVKSLTLPNSSVFVIAMDLIAAGTPTAATPSFNPLPGKFTTGPTLTLSDTTPGASIYFTTNGTTPTTSSTKYTAPFKITVTTGVETVEAIVVASGYTNSPVVIAAYTINSSVTQTAANPGFGPMPGSFTFAQTITLTDATPAASIYYTTNGTTPTPSSTKYTAPFKVGVTSTVKAIATATGYLNSAVSSGLYTITTPAPTGLSYPIPPPLLVGRAVTLSPTVTGTVSAYAVSPALPAGLKINTTTGVISGTPTTVTAAVRYGVAAANGSGSTTFTLPLKVDPGPTVHLAATATDPNGFALTYQWQTTDGTLLNVNGAQADWLLPAGLGLHFAYVLVSNGTGGFAERQIAVTTDELGVPLAPGTPNPANYATPPQPAYAGKPKRLFISNAQNDYFSAFPANVAVPGAPVFLYDQAAGRYLTNDASCPTTTPAPGVAPPPPACGLLTDNKGSAVFEQVTTLNSSLTASCGITPYSGAVCNPAPPLQLPSNSYYIFGYPFPNGTGSGPSVTRQGVPSISGSIAQADGNLSGKSEPFFGVDAPDTVQLYVPFCSGSGTECATSAIVNDFGDFAVPLPTTAIGANVGLNMCFTGGCFINVTPASISIGKQTLAAAASPIISAITASYNGSGSFGGSSIVVPPGVSAPMPSDSIVQSDAFLSFKGTDTRLGACRYYQAIGAVPPSGCDANGFYSGAIKLTDWKSAVGLYPVKPGAVTAGATYLNAVDLNLTRVHQSVAYPNTPYGANSYPVAAVVCNHLGPRDTNGNPITVNLQPTPLTPAQQQAVDSAVANATAGHNEIACVAMDYTATTGANGGKPFTRFLVFGPSGELLPSVNLDGRGEKFLPGACIACHGGDNYNAKFPVDGTGLADVGAHFLPYDVGNFAFSSVSSLTRDAQEAQILQLNANIQGTNPTDDVKYLFAGWYQKSGSSTPQPPLNQSFISEFWQIAGPDLYLKVIAKSCRTCHAVLPIDMDAIHSDIYLDSFPELYCGGSPNRIINHAMPNSLVAFNRFWNSRGTTDASGSSTDQPALLSNFIIDYAGYVSPVLSGGCKLNQGP